MSRKKAAAVPASKAKIGAVYAVRRDGQLTRFRVQQVTIHRVADDGSPHDYKSEITGHFILHVDDEGSFTTEKATIEPGQLLGEFAQYEELVKVKEAEDLAKRRRGSEEKEQALELMVLLYKVAGLPVPDNTAEYDAPFRLAGYSGTSPPDIGRKGVKPLLDGLRKLIGNADLAHSANLIEREKIDS